MKTKKEFITFYQNLYQFFGEGRAFEIISDHHIINEQFFDRLCGYLRISFDDEYGDVFKEFICEEDTFLEECKEYPEYDSYIMTDRMFKIIFILYLSREEDKQKYLKISLKTYSKECSNILDCEEIDFKELISLINENESFTALHGFIITKLLDNISKNELFKLLEFCDALGKKRKYSEYHSPYWNMMKYQSQYTYNEYSKYKDKSRDKSKV